jgi:hypothetical protein
MLLISTAARVYLVLFYLLIIADRFWRDIGIKDKWYGHWQLADRLSFMDLTALFLVFILVDCRIKSTGMLTNLKARFWTCAGVKQISHASVCFLHPQSPTAAGVWGPRHSPPPLSRARVLSLPPPSPRAMVPSSSATGGHGAVLLHRPPPPPATLPSSSAANLVDFSLGTDTSGKAPGWWSCQLVYSTIGGGEKRERR